jgi:hypothetical protein
MKFLADKQFAAWENDHRIEILLEKLLTIGGQFAVFPVVEEDLMKLVKRGEWFPKYRYMKRLWKGGEPCHCHSNACHLHEQCDYRIVTGYALSKYDPCWKQHSWCLDFESNTLVETTIIRAEYFGFIMTPVEAKKFCRDNP